MHTATVDDSLRLGPLLRHVSDTTATVWVQTAHPTRVTVRCAGREASAPTFGVHGFHYALVVLTGLEPGSVNPYTVSLDGERVWPPRDSTFPESRIATLDASTPTRLAFGSCRTCIAHDAEGNASHGVDALRAYAVSMLEEHHHVWPDLFCFLGDQVYADEETPREMHDFMAARRDLDEPPGEEVKDFVEYEYLYQLAWSDPVVRWLLSTVPSAMIFDDHDVRDDWNTSWSWREDIRLEPWWQERIVAALSSYWVYQHAGNLHPDELAGDPIWQLVTAHAESGASEELDLTERLDAFAAEADRSPDSVRWSYTRDLGDSRLVVIDSRAARDLHPDRRSMLDPTETAWLDEQLRGDVEHLFIGTSLPFLLPPGLHDFEAMSEVMAQGGWGRTLGRAAEKVRRTIDLEHWAAFNDGFVDVFEMVMQVARGERGAAPKIITFLSGDVHNSYVAEVVAPGRYGARSRIVQAVCSPMRNPMPKAVRVFMSLFAKSLVKPMRWVAGRSPKVPDPAYPWTVTRGPWFDNNLAVVEVDADGGGLKMQWYAGEDIDEHVDDPVLRTVARVRIEAPPTQALPVAQGSAVGSGSAQGDAGR